MLFTIAQTARVKIEKLCGCCCYCCSDGCYYGNANVIAISLILLQIFDHSKVIFFFFCVYEKLFDWNVKLVEKRIFDLNLNLKTTLSLLFAIFCFFFFQIVFIRSEFVIKVSTFISCCWIPWNCAEQFTSVCVDGTYRYIYWINS